MSDVFFRYVPRARVSDYLALGWEDRGPAPGSHGLYSNIMRWTRDESPVEPQ